jgi:hypothetical protein
LAKLTFQPLVFVSSSIASMRGLRKKTKAAIDATGMADTWLFEFDAAASGDPPDAQYLAMARSCDIFVLIAAERISEPTWAEYEEAYRDNPSKIVPILIGAPHSQDDSRLKVLEDRHCYGRARLESADEVPQAAKTAVEYTITSGAILARPLREIAKKQLDHRRRLLALPGKFEFPCCVLDGSLQSRDLTGMLADVTHLVVQGPAGSGKTYLALKHLAELTDYGSLPVYLRVARSESRDFFELISDAISAVRFRADQPLLAAWANDGRLSLVLDGLDQMDDEACDRMIEVIDIFARAHPRCPVVVLMRSVVPARLPDFVRVEAAIVPDDSVVRLFQLDYAISLAGRSGPGSSRRPAYRQHRRSISSSASCGITWPWCSPTRPSTLPLFVQPCDKLPCLIKRPRIQVLNCASTESRHGRSRPPLARGTGPCRPIGTSSTSRSPG